MSRLPTLAASAFCVAACAARPNPPDSLEATSPVAPAARAEVGAPRLDETTRPARAGDGITELTLSRPEDVACALSASTWSGALQLRPGGPSFATARSAKATLQIPRDGSAGFVDITESFDVSAFVSDPQVHLARPMALGDFAVPFSGTVLALQAPHPEGMLTVGIDVSDVFEAPGVVTQAVRCADLGPVPGSYDAETFARTPQSIDTTLAARTPLRSSPRGEPVAVVRRVNTPVRFGALENGRRRVVFEGRGYLAVGWVDAHAVDVPRTPFLRGLSGRFASRVRSPTTTVCGTSVPLFAQVGGERAVVGRLRAGSRFWPSSRNARGVPPGFASIEAPSEWLAIAPGALLLLLESDLQRCRSSTPVKGS